MIAIVSQTREIGWKSPGVAIITATTEDGSVKASCNLTNNSSPTSNGYSYVRWGTDLQISNKSFLYIDEPMKDTIYFQYGAGFLNNSKDNWVEFHLTTPQGKIFKAMDYPDISWFNITNITDFITDTVIEYTTDGENFSSEKPTIQNLEGFRIHYTPKISASLELFVNLKLKVNNLREEDKRKMILPIQLKNGYHLYGPSTEIIADGITSYGINTFNVYFAK